MYKVFLGFLYPVFYLIFRVVFRLRVTGIENIPAGGAIIAPNHQSFWDIPLLGMAIGRRVHFMAKEELFRVSLFGWVIRQLLAFPIKRGAPDRAAIRHAVELLKGKDLLVVFPEGTRSKTGKLGEFEPGIAMIAMKAEVPIVPAAIIGTNQIWGRGIFFPRIELYFGIPLNTLVAPEEQQAGSDMRKRMELLGGQLRIAIIELITKNS